MVTLKYSLRKCFLVIQCFFILSLVVLPVSSFSGFNINLSLKDTSSGLSSTDMDQNTILNSISTNEDLAENLTFDLEELLNYIDGLHNSQVGIFKEAANGYETSIATFEALSTLRFFGLDYHLFGNDWQLREDKISTKLIIDLLDSSGGFLLTEESSKPTLEGTYGVVSALWIMYEVSPTKLKGKASALMDFVINDTYDKEIGAFAETNQEASLEATFKALTILDLIQKTAVIPAYIDETITPRVNNTVYEFMKNYTEDLSLFINGNFVNGTHFDSYNPLNTPLEDTWYALQSIAVLERFNEDLGLSMTENLQYYKDSVVNWLKNLQKTSGETQGGFGIKEFATVTETGYSFAILNLLNSTDMVDRKKAISFIYASQFLKRENRTYSTVEEEQIGGFGPNNLTYSSKTENHRINVHDTYFASLSLLLSGAIFESTETSIITSRYKEQSSINKTNLIIQGELATIELSFKVYNFKTHGSLDLSTTVDNWNLSYSSYRETNPTFRGKSSAIYSIQLENDSESNFNWTLGDHLIANKISIRHLPVIKSPSYLLNDILFVSYKSLVHFNQSTIAPGDNISTTIYYQNKSINSFEIFNITSGLVSATLTKANAEEEVLFIDKTINETIGAIKIFINISKQAVLGTWSLNLTYQQSSFILMSIFKIEVTDTIMLYNIDGLPEYYPGEFMNLNVSLKYSSGQFTPKANATIAFISNSTSNEVFYLNLRHSNGNIYTAMEQECPRRYLKGFYNISVKFTWNSSSSIQPKSVKNDSLRTIQIGGEAVLSEVELSSDQRGNLTFVANNIIYFGETINLSLTIGFITDSGINYRTNDTINIKGGLINNSIPKAYIQLLNTIIDNDSIVLRGMISTNLPKETFGSRFQIKSEWNGSYIYLLDPNNINRSIGYNFTLDGQFLISDINYIGGTLSRGLFTYALDTTTTVIISFRVVNGKLDNISIANLNLYAILDILDDESDLINQTLPSITEGRDANDTSIYFLSVPITNLKPKDYQISLYTKTAFSKNLLIGQLLPGMKIVTKLSPQPLFQVHEVLILIGVGFLAILLYLNLKRG